MIKDDCILITGGHGLVGTTLYNYFIYHGFNNIIRIGRGDCDLLNRQATEVFFKKTKPKYVFHAAARVYGIMGNIKNKASSFYENLLINTHVIDAATAVGVKKIIAMGSGAVYPYPPPGLPLKEDSIFMGEPHPSEDSYAYAKRAMLAMLKAYQESYGLNWSYVVSCNLFGPFDKFDPDFGHVIPSLISKFYDSKINNQKVIVWGNGSSVRDFMYAKDLARLLVLIAEKINGVVNIGSGKNYSIKEIVDMISQISKMENSITWDATKPNGQEYRSYDLSIISGHHFQCEYSIFDGLKETWDWYCDYKKN
jgi:GDP-L-fucose synthase